MNELHKTKLSDMNCQMRKEMEQRDSLLVNLEDKLLKMEATEQHPSKSD